MNFKNALVAGTGKSGISAAKLLIAHGVKVTLFDENEKRDKNDLMEKLSQSELVTILLGKLTDEVLKQTDIMVISPGIPVDSAFVEDIKKAGIPVWSEIELAYYFGKGKIAAITGTNGKTTTTALVGEIVKAWNPKTIVVGNIGIPYTELCDTTDDDSATVAEISSFQLETIVDFHPNVSAILNLTPDHLNRHYTFENYEEDQKQGVENVKKLLTDNGLEQDFSDLFEVRVGHLIPGANDDYDVFDLSSVMSRVEQLPDSEDKDILLNNLEYVSYPYLISLSGYNHVLELAGKEPLALSDDEAAVFKSLEFTSDSMNQNINDILADRPEVAYLDHKMYLTGKIQNTPLITDRAITLSFALIVPDEIFDKYTWDSTIYLNGVLDQSKVKGDNLLQSVMQMNDKLAQIDFAAKNIEYESYLKNMGRRMFYIVAASYITIYLAIIFLIIANTVIGVQFLMGQQKSGRRYKTLIRLGATYELLCRSARKQINWYFGMPVVVAGISSIFGVRAVLTLVSGMISNSIGDAMLLAAAMILLLCVVECIYMAFVKRSSNRYLLTLMVPEREE